MKLVRSWPQKPPDKHPRIEDNCERVYIPTIDYSPMLQLNDNVLHLDWDIAIGRDELRAFARKCLAEPEIVRVAPTLANPTRQRRWHMTHGLKRQWMVWKLNADKVRVELKPGEPFCNVFAFGVVYLPRWTIAGMVGALHDEPEKYGKDFLDINFSYWYHDASNGQGVPVEWDANVVHLNYSMKDALTNL